MSTEFQRDLYLEVEEISADLAITKEILEKVLAVQERQEAVLKTIAACLEKITGTMSRSREAPSVSAQ